MKHALNHSLNSSVSDFLLICSGRIIDTRLAEKLHTFYYDKICGFTFDMNGIWILVYGLKLQIFR